MFIMKKLNQWIGWIVKYVSNKYYKPILSPDDAGCPLESLILYTYCVIWNKKLTCLAIPKSASLTTPYASTSKLAPLMSLEN